MSFRSITKGGISEALAMVIRESLAAVPEGFMARTQYDSMRDMLKVEVTTRGCIVTYFSLSPEMLMHARFPGDIIRAEVRMAVDRILAATIPT